MAGTLLALYLGLAGSKHLKAAFLSPGDSAMARTEEGVLAPAPSRREGLAGLATSLALPLAGFSAPVRAEEAPPPRLWQMKLPEGWQVFQKFSVPPVTETRTKELLLAGDPSAGAEVKVLHIPLMTTPQDPQGTGALTLIEYFQIPFPRVGRKSVINSLSKSFAKQPASFSLNLIGEGEDKVKLQQKYMSYEFELRRCEGKQTYGTNGKICTRSDTGDILPTQKFHHLTIQTVTPEPGMTDKASFAEILWIVDISAPAKSWENLTEAVKIMTDSFAVGTVDELAKIRNGTAT